MLKCSISLGLLNISLQFFLKYSPASTINPALPHAGSTIISSGVGFISSTIILIICLGVLNCPFVPAVDNLESRYS